MSYAIGGIIAGLLVGAVMTVAFLFEKDPWGVRRFRRMTWRGTFKDRSQW